MNLDNNQSLNLVANYNVYSDADSSLEDGECTSPVDSQLNEERLLREKLIKAYNARKRKSSESASENMEKGEKNSKMDDILLFDDDEDEDETYNAHKRKSSESASETMENWERNSKMDDILLFDDDEDEDEIPDDIVSVSLNDSHDEHVPRCKFDSINSTSEGEEEVYNHQENTIKVHNIEEETDNGPMYYPAIQGCRLLSNYEFLNKIEEGTYGEVFRARDKHTMEIVALKRLKMENEKYGFPITSLREVNTLMKAQHENIVTVREVVVGHDIDKIYLVMDFVEHDLKSLMRVIGRQFSVAEVKCLMLQLLAAIAHLHDNWIIHRDIKTSNLLLSHNGVLKVADFGLAREYGSPLKKYTNLVVTLWYRAPELLLGQKLYSTHIDMWSVGCIFGEMMLHRPMFCGKSETEQIQILFRELGVPTEEVWPGVSELPVMKKINYKSKEKPRNEKKLATRLSNSGKYVMNKLLTFCPEKRFTAEEARNHYYFSETPLAIHPSQFPKFPAKSETIPKKSVPPPKRIFN